MGNKLCILILWLLSVAILYNTITYYTTPKKLLDPRGTGVVKVQVVEAAAPKDWNKDLVGYFRYRGQQLGYNDFLITHLHGVMDCENGLHTANRKNYKYDGENGHYTAAGFAMITKSTFKNYKCIGDRFNGVDNINCFYKIYAKNGLKDYKASESCWRNK